MSEIFHKKDKKEEFKKEDKKEEFKNLISSP